MIQHAGFVLSFKKVVGGRTDAMFRYIMQCYPQCYISAENPDEREEVDVSLISCAVTRRAAGAAGVARTRERSNESFSTVVIYGLLTGVNPVELSLDDDGEAFDGLITPTA